MPIAPDNQSTATTPFKWPPWDGENGGAGLYCRRCRYSLRGLDSRRCPECGQPFDPADPKTYFITPRTSRTAIAALVLAVLGVLTIVILVGMLFLVFARILAKNAMNAIDRVEGGIPGRGIARAAALVAILGQIAFVIVHVGMCSLMVSRHSRSRALAHKMDNAAHVNEVLNTLVLWSTIETSTHDFPKVGVRGYAYPDNSVVNRCNFLCNYKNGLTPGSLVNPQSTDTPWQGTGPVSLASTNISYALLDAGNPEWKFLNNAAAPLVCDKRVGQGSAWNKTKWEGHVGWGDFHVSWEAGQTVPTVMGGVAYPQDDLWKQSATNDALMINP